MLLIFPPVAKPGEPPAGIAKLAGALKAHGISCDLLDANIEGLLFLLGRERTSSDTWTKRAVKHVSTNIALLRDPKTYQSPDRYSRAVRDVNRVLSVSGGHGALVGLADYQHRSLSSLLSADLLFSAAHPEQNPFYPYFSKRLPEMLDRATTGMVGLSLNYLSQALTAFAMIGFTRKEFPGVKIILGGGLVSSWMKRLGFQNPFGNLVDHLIAGPGEGPLLDLLGNKGGTENRLCPKSPLSPALSHQGRGYPSLDGRGEGRVSVSPEYSSLPVRDYLSPGFILPYSGSSGCYWNKCSFCPETAEDNPYVLVPLPQAMADLRALAENMKPVIIHLLDNSVSPALMQALAADPVGAPWYGFARIGKDLCDLDYCMALRRSGCVMLKLGLESGDQGVLDRLNKGIDLETASKVLTNLSKAGIATYIYLLFGTPAETVVEARKTLEYVAAHAEAITFLNLAIFNLPVCGAEAALYETGQFYEGDLSLYSGFRHPRGWDRKEVRRFLDAEFKRHPAVAVILKNDPPVFTSNHAAFFVPATRVKP